jgi:hypothetical protein
LVAEAAVLLIPAVACFFMALNKGEPGAGRSRIAAGKEQEHHLSEKDADTRSRDMANRNSGEPDQLAKLSEVALTGQWVKPSDRSVAKHETEPSKEPPWLSWFIAGSLLGAVIGLVLGAVGGAMIASEGVEDRALAFFLGSLGAVIGAIVGAPVGLLIGQIAGVLMGEIVGLIVGLITLLVVIALLPFRRSRETRIGAFFASPNPVTAGSSMTLTARKITAASGGATVVEVAFYARILDLYGSSETLLGYGTPTGSGSWTMNLAVSLAAGSHALRALARDSSGTPGFSRRLTLTVQ